MIKKYKKNNKYYRKLFMDQYKFKNNNSLMNIEIYNINNNKIFLEISK